MEYKNELIPRNDDCRCGCDGCAGECDVYTDISIPLEIEPEAKIGEVKVECCGDPSVKMEPVKHGCYKIVITQKIIIKIPVCYEVKVKTDC